MWFSKLTFFTIDQPSDIDLTDLAEKLNQHQLKDCGSGDAFTFGWVPLIDNSEVWSCKVNSALFMKGCKEVKVVDNTVLKQELAKKVHQLECEKGAKLGRNEKTDLREELLFTMRANAPSKKVPVECFIDLDGGYLAINSTQDAAHSNIFKLMQKTLGSFPVRPLSFSPTTSPNITMTKWIYDNDVPGSLTPTDYIMLADKSEEKPSIEFKKMEPLSSDITQHLGNGMHVEKVALSWQDKMTFVLDTHLNITKIKFMDIMKEKVREDSAGGPAADMDAICALQSLEINELFKSLWGWFECKPI